MIFRNQEASEHFELMSAIQKTGEDAPCANYPDAFFAEYKEVGGEYARQIAISLCQGCPVKNLCADYGIRWQPIYGIYGGLHPSQRRKIRLAREAAGIEMPKLDDQEDELAG
jgi:WhiB family redox-sensing transcriptional regulator